MPTVDVLISKPHAGQQKLDTALDGARFGIVMCGRRFGKTKYGIYKACTAALKGQRVGWFAPTYKYAQEAWREISNRLRPASAKASDQQMRLETVNGGVIECWTMDSPDPGRGRAYHLVVIDEAGIVRELEAIWQQAIRPTLADYRGKALFLGTPKGRTHAFSQLFAKGVSGDEGWRSVRAPTTDNPYIPADEIEAARRDMPAAVFAQEFEGVPSDDGGNPFGLTAIAACVEPLGSEAAAVWGWDFARAQDWTVGIALDVYGHVCRFERWQGKPWGETRRLVSEATKSVQAAGDSTGIGDVVVESIQSMGVPMTGYMFTPKSKQALMERLANAIQTRTITFPEGPIRGELETFSYEYTAHGVRYSAPEGLHDDCVMALALAVYMYDRVQPSVPAMAVPQQLHGRDQWATQPDEMVEVGPASQLPYGF